MNQTHYLRPRLRRERFPEPIDLPKLIIQTVESVFMLEDINEYQGRKRESGVFPRQIAHALLKKYTPLSYDKIGKLVGNKNHATVISSCRQVQNALDTLQKVGHDQLGTFYMICENNLRKQI